jgi:hypothetical protein
VHQQVQVVPDMQVAELQRAAERDDQGCVECALGAERAFLRAFVTDAVLALEDAGREWFGWDAA